MLQQNILNLPLFAAVYFPAPAFILLQQTFATLRTTFH